MASKLVPAYEKTSGRQVMVPEHWIGHARLGAGLVKRKPSGVDPVYDRSNPDAPGVSQPHTKAETSPQSSDSKSGSGSSRTSPAPAPAGTASNPQE